MGFARGKVQSERKWTDVLSWTRKSTRLYSRYSAVAMSVWWRGNSCDSGRITYFPWDVRGGFLGTSVRLHFSHGTAMALPWDTFFRGTPTGHPWDLHGTFASGLSWDLFLRESSKCFLPCFIGTPMRLPRYFHCTSMGIPSDFGKGHSWTPWEFHYDSVGLAWDSHGTSTGR